MTLRDGHGVDGGGVYAPVKILDVIYLESCILVNNSAVRNGGGMFLTQATKFVVTSCSFAGNSAGSSGGAVWMDSSVLDVQSSSFTRNEAGLSGGAIRAISTTTGSAITFRSVLSNSNFAAGGGGGSVSAIGSVVSFSDATSGHNDTCNGRDGGGFLHLEACNAQLSDVTMTKCRSVTASGGAIAATGTQLRVARSSIVESVSSGSGGAFLVSLTTLDVLDTLFDKNIAVGDRRANIGGGALSLQVRSKVVVSGSTFQGNSATTGGGAIICDGCDVLVLLATSFRSNAAGRGGAISLIGEPTSVPTSIDIACSFVDNVALLGGGGAIYWSSAIIPAINPNVTHSGNIGLYGNFVGSGPKNLRLMSFADVVRNTEPLAPTVVVVDYYGNQIVDQSQSDPLTLVVAAKGEAQPFGSLYALVNQEGSAVFPEFGLAAKPGKHSIVVQASVTTVAELVFDVVVQDCLAGEWLTSSEGLYACSKCVPGFFTDGSTRNPTKCTPCERGTYQAASGASFCGPCKRNEYSQSGAIACGDPIVDDNIPTVISLSRSINRSMPDVVLLAWFWPEGLDAGVPMVDVALGPDFAEVGRGLNANLSVTVNEDRLGARVKLLPFSSNLARSSYDTVVYARVRIDTGVAVGQWSSLLAPWLIRADCDDDNFLDDLGAEGLKPDLWNCTKCPAGGDCKGRVRWPDVRSKFGWWRVDEENNEQLGVPDMFARCLFGAACLGTRNLQLAGKFYNISEEVLSEGEEEENPELLSQSKGLTSSNDMALVGYEHEHCNEQWGHSEICEDGLKRNSTGQPVLVRCRLCSSCRQGFKKFGRARCKICPEATANRVLLVVGFVVVVAAGVTVVFLSIQSAGSEAEVSEGVKKIGINFLQICSLAALFPLKWPAPVEAMFNVMAAVSSPAQHLLSPDCELSWMSPARAFYNKQIGFSILPIAAIIICMLLWLTAFALSGRKSGKTRHYYYDRACLTVVCILFLLYPTMVKQSTAALACEKIGIKYYLAADLQEACYVGRHMYYLLSICLPQVLVYTIGLPIVGTLVLWSNRTRLKDLRVRFRYGILYNGYRPRLYWWEITIAIRKVALVLIAGVYGVRLGPDLQVVVALLLIMLFTALHLVFSPFSVEDERFMKEIPEHVQKAREERKILQQSAREKQKNKLELTKEEQESLSEETKDKHDEDNEHDKIEHHLCERKYWSKLYFRLIKNTNMHMIEFGSLSVCALTLWSGLVFFLNDLKPRFSQNVVIFFSVCLAVLNVLFIAWIVVKFVLAVLKEQHTKKVIEVWAAHSFLELHNHAHTHSLIKNKAWKRTVQKIHKGKNRGAVRVVPTVSNKGKGDMNNNFAPGEKIKEKSFWELSKTAGQNGKKPLHDLIDLKKIQAHQLAVATENDYAASQASKLKMLDERAKRQHRKLESRIAKRKSVRPVTLPKSAFDPKKVLALRIGLSKKIKSHKTLEKIFKRLDKEHDGTLSHEEFNQLIIAVNKNAEAATMLGMWEGCWDQIPHTSEEGMNIEVLWNYISASKLLRVKQKI